MPKSYSTQSWRRKGKKMDHRAKYTGRKVKALTKVHDEEVGKEKMNKMAERVGRGCKTKRMYSGERRRWQSDDARRRGFWTPLPR